MKKLKVGMVVHHSRYGWGLIKEVEENRVWIIFDSGKYRKVAPYNLVKESAHRRGFVKFIKEIWGYHILSKDKRLFPFFRR